MFVKMSVSVTPWRESSNSGVSTTTTLRPVALSVKRMGITSAVSDSRVFPTATLGFPERRLINYKVCKISKIPLRFFSIIHARRIFLSR